MIDDATRKEILLKLGAGEAEVAELLIYNKNCFEMDKEVVSSLQIMEDEPFVPVWLEYAAEAQHNGVFATLKKYLVQLNFPIKSGISSTDSYKAVTLRGTDVTTVKEATGLMLEYPENLQLTIFQTFAGKIPILFTGHREDFKSLVRALAMKNELYDVPDSMGACMVKGLNNWDRVQRSGMMLSELIPHKELYQDKLIILSGGIYSGVSAQAMGLDQAEWERLSVIIRREHECAHYLTQRFYGSARNNLFDELIADYVGITEAAGTFREDWCLRFLGLENYPQYRKGARLENYRGDPPILDRSFIIMQKLAYYTIQGLKQLDAKWQAISKEQRIRELCAMNLEEILQYSFSRE